MSTCHWEMHTPSHASTEQPTRVIKPADYAFLQVCCGGAGSQEAGADICAPAQQRSGTAGDEAAHGQHACGPED